MQAQWIHALLLVVVFAHPAESFTVPGLTSRADSSHVSSLRCQLSDAISRRQALEFAIALPFSAGLLPQKALAASPVMPSMWGVPLPTTIDESFVDGVAGPRYKEVYAGIGRSPTQGDSVRVLLSTFSMEGAALGPMEKVEKYDLSNENVPEPLKAALMTMKMGAQRVLYLPRDSSRPEPVIAFVKLLAIVGHICSSDEEEIRKGNILDFHTCGEVTESTERIRLFCEKVQCIEQSYLDVQSRKK